MFAWGVTTINGVGLGFEIVSGSGINTVIPECTKFGIILDILIFRVILGF